MSGDERTPLPPDANGFCYADEAHFDETLVRVARDQLVGRARLLEQVIIPLGILLTAAASVVVCSGIGVAGGLAVFVLTVPLLVRYIRREGRRVRKIEREKLCLKCAYSLRNLSTGEDGWATCPECGARFHEGYYRRPPPLYRRPGESPPP